MWAVHDCVTYFSCSGNDVTFFCSLFVVYGNMSCWVSKRGIRNYIGIFFCLKQKYSEEIIVQIYIFWIDCQKWKIKFHKKKSYQKISITKLFYQNCYFDFKKSDRRFFKLKIDWEYQIWALFALCYCLLIKSWE